MVTITLTESSVTYLMELVYADLHRMRSLLEHARSHGERTHQVPAMVSAMEIIDAVGKGRGGGA